MRQAVPSYNRGSLPVVGFGVGALTRFNFDLTHLRRWKRGKQSHFALLTPHKSMAKPYTRALEDINYG
jgi:hypothetical protein